MAFRKFCIQKNLEPQKIALARTNTTEGLNYVLEQFKKSLIIDYALVDGSLNRLSPVFILDKLVFTTGSARNMDIDILIEEMMIIEKVFSYDV